MKALFLVAGLLLTAATFAQPNANDDCSNALVVPVTSAPCPSTFNATTVGATASSQPGCVGSAEDDIWFKFTATQSALVLQVSYDFIFIYNPVIELFSGTCGSLTSIKCSQRKASSTVIRDIFTGLTPGVEYYARFYEAGNPSNRYPMRICVYEPVPGDECTNAVPVAINTDTSWANYTQGSFQNLTASGAHCTGAYINSGDIWYSFVANDTVQLLHHNVDNFNQGYTYQVYSGACGSLTAMDISHTSGWSVTCHAPSNGNIDGYFRLRNLVAGNTYYMRVMRDSTRYTSNTFRFALSNVPANDVCVNAIEVPVNSGNDCIQKVQGNTRNGTGATLPNSVCGTSFSDVWFKFTATASRHIVSTRVFNVAPIYNIGFEVMSGSCSNPTGIVCSNGGRDLRMAELNGLTPGQTYYLRVAGGDAFLFFNKPFEICITTPPVTPVNETCADAILLSNTNLNYTLGAFTGATPSLTNNSCAGNLRDLWYRLVPPYNASITVRLVESIVTGNNAADAQLTLLGGTCGGLTVIGCGTTNVNNNSVVSFNALGGQTYYVRVTTNNTFDPAVGPLAIYISGLSALPVTMKDFRISKVTDKSIGLVWQTADESQMRAYFVQRSNDGRTFTDIGSLPAKNEASNEYNFTDNQPLSGTNYYRLRIVDMDDKVEYSKIVDAGLRGAGNFHVYAVGRGLRIVNDKNTQVQANLSIYDGAGRNLRSRQMMLKPGVNTISDLQLSKGSISFVHLDTPEGLQVFKIIW